MLAIPVKPKESSSLFPWTEETPIPKARIKGTAKGPVVAPPASKPTDARKGGRKSDRRHKTPIQRAIVILKENRERALR